MNDNTHQLKLGAVISYITIAFNILTGLIYTPWLISLIGQDHYGIYTLVTSLISLFIIDFGIGVAVAKFISNYNTEKDQQSINNLMGIVYKLYLIIDVIILTTLIVIYFFIDNIYTGLTPGELSVFKVVYIIAATFSVISFPFTTLNGILTAYEKFIYLKSCDLINKVITVTFTIIALLLGYGLYALVLVNAISGLATIAIKYIIIRKKTPINSNIKFKSKTILKDIFSFSIWSTIITIAEKLIFNITPSILGAVSNSINIAIFGIANTLEGFVFTFANAINGMFLPTVSRMINKENSEENILRLMIKLGRIQLIIIGILIIGFISVGREFIVLWMGEGYITSYYCTLFLIIPSFISLTQEIANTTVIALNKVKEKSYVYISSSVLNILLSLILSKYLGVLGASIAICISYLVRYAVMNIIYYKSLEIDVIRFFKECHLKMSLPLLLSLFISLGVHYSINSVTWFTFLVKINLVLISYALIMWFMAFNRFEKDLILGTIKTLSRKTNIFKR
ncbi:oligosaccharide flippase family protein [Paenibacillus sp. BAC0078]